LESTLFEHVQYFGFEVETGFDGACLLYNSALRVAGAGLEEVECDVVVVCSV